MKRKNNIKISSLILFTLLLFSCGTTSTVKNQPAEESPLAGPETEPVVQEEQDKDSITLLFAGDIMAHSVNYQISTYSKIWRDVQPVIHSADLAFANIEAPVDTTKAASSYPNFNMTKKYVQAAIDAGFDVFSLCNNHTNDQGLTGIKETMKTTAALTDEALERNQRLYFSGLKASPQAALTYNLIDYHGWKILFLPITELLNRPSCSEYINFIDPSEKSREDFISLVRRLRDENPCDLFVLSVHTSEPEYTRLVTDKQREYYHRLLEAGADILWANHAHIIKDREFVFDTNTHRQKLIMYACGNTISGQRTKPELTSKNPNGERDNTGDGLFYIVTFTKNNPDFTIAVKDARAYFVTTYINTAWEFVIKPLDQGFVDYLYDVPRKSWAEYIERRIKINKNATKDYITWQ